MTWENVNVHAPPESTGPLRRLFKKDDKAPERKHIIQNGKYLYQGKHTNKIRWIIREIL